MNIETNVTIMSINLSKKTLSRYKEYYIIDDNFTYDELLKNKRVIFFNVLNNLKENELNKLFKFLKDNDIKFINITNNMELCLYTDYLIILDNDNVLIEGLTLEVLKNDKLLKRLGFELPFLVDLSLLLKDYNLVNKIYLNNESLVGALWK